MRIFEVEDQLTSKLLALAQFSLGRADDEGSQKQMSTGAFLKIAKSMGIDITADQLQSLSNKPPLDGIMLPIEPGADIIKFKGSEPESVGMPVDQAQKIVAKAAKSAMKRGMKS